jgi:hypothetical protein
MNFLQLAHSVKAGRPWVFSLKQKTGLQSVVVTAESCFISVAGLRFILASTEEYAADATWNSANMAE